MVCSFFYFFFLSLFFQLGIWADIPSHPSHDSQTQIQQLDNGLTCYVRENHYPEKRAYLSLVVKVGSFYEKEEEKGIAHFIEHLNFRGSTHFEDGKMIRYLESIGAWFSIDTNAHTNFDSTVYKLELPLNEEEELDQALLVLRDFAGNAFLQDEIVEKERSVVLDEWHHHHSSADMKLEKKVMNSFLCETCLADRLPIGNKEVIENTSGSKLRDFYKKWYSADRMAVVAVGDFDSKKMQQKIETLFSDIPTANEKEPQKISLASIAPTVLTHFDPQIPYTRILLYSYYPSSEKKYSSIEDEIREKFLLELIHNCFEKKFLEFKSSNLSLFAFAKQGEFLPGEIDICARGSVLLSDSCQEGIEAFQHLLNKILKEGFTEEEWKLSIAQSLQECDRLQKNLNLINHEVFASKCISHFLYHRPILSISWVNEQYKQIANSLKIEECNSFLNLFHFQDPFHILFVTSDSDAFEKISPQFLEEVFRGEKKPTDSTIANSTKSTFTYTEPEEEGSILQRSIENEVEKWTLSNEIPAFLKKTDLENDRVILCLQSNKGLANILEEEICSAVLLPYYIFQSGMNKLSYFEFSSYLQSLGISMHMNITLSETTLYFSLPSQHMETVFQIVHDLFSSFHFDRSKWKIVTNEHKEMRKQQRKNPTTRFHQFVTKTNRQDHYLFRPLDVNSVSAETAESLMPFFFGNPKDFALILIGDFEHKQAEQLVKKYLASLPTYEQKNPPISMKDSFFPSKQIKEEFVDGSNSYETTIITIPFDAKNLELNLTAICKAIDQRLMKRLRWELGSTYGVYTHIDCPYYPYLNAASIQIIFTCQTQDRERLIQAVFDEIEKSKTEKFTQQEIDGLHQLLIRKREESSLSNQFWFSEISRLVRLHRPFAELNRDKESIEEITPESVLEIANRIFASPYHSVITHKSVLQK